MQTQPFNSSGPLGDSSQANKDLLMRTVLFGMLFYVINNDLTRHILRKIVVIPVEILQVALFSILYVGISMCISLK